VKSKNRLKIGSVLDIYLSIPDSQIMNENRTLERSMSTTTIIKILKPSRHAKHMLERFWGDYRFIFNTLAQGVSEGRDPTAKIFMDLEGRQVLYREFPDLKGHDVDLIRAAFYEIEKTVKLNGCDDLSRSSVKPIVEDRAMCLTFYRRSFSLDTKKNICKIRLSNCEIPYLEPFPAGCEKPRRLVINEVNGVFTGTFYVRYG
jgi:hypothetical protein